MRPAHLLVSSLLVAALLTSCGKSEKAQTAAPAASSSHAVTAAKPAPVAPVTPPTLADPKPADYPGVHNVVAFSDGLLSGSVPEGDAGFDTLQGMGVKTVISVDGAAPDLARAKAHGMKYIHLPISYNGMSDERKMEIARAVQVAQKENPGAPVYLHCHHGKHRSAGALGTAAVTLGYATPESTVERMKVSGTAPSYTGLYKCVQVSTPANAAQLAMLPSTFPEVYKTSDFVQSMVEVDEVFDHLKLIEKAGWKAPKDHPDLVPAAEAGRLADLFRQGHESDTARTKTDEFRHWLLEDSKKCEKLESDIVAGNVSAEALSAQFKVISASCKECHVKYRD